MTYILIGLAALLVFHIYYRIGVCLRLIEAELVARSEADAVLASRASNLEAVISAKLAELYARGAA